MSILKKQAYKGVFWTILQKAGTVFFQFFIGIILARILSPDDFGLVAMVSVFIAISSVFIDSGFSKALINKKETTYIEETSVFWLNLFLSFVIFLFLFLLAPYIAQFYNEPVLTNITRALGLVLIIQAFGAIHLTILTKELDFKTQFKLTIFSKFIAGIVAIWAAYNGYGVWSLIIQLFLQALLNSIGLWIFHKWRPRFLFRLKSLETLWKFGSNILFSRLLRTTFNNIYSLAIGKTFSAADLGFYRRAYEFQNLPISFLSASIGKVGFPLYSKVKDDKKKFIQVMRKSLILMNMISFPILAGIGVMAEPIIIILITEKWLPSVPYLQLLCISGMIYPWHLMNVQALLGYGRSDLNLKITFIKNLMRLINLIIMLNFSVLHIIVGEVILSLIALIINTYYSNKIFNYGFLRQFKDLGNVIVSTILIILTTGTPLFFDFSIEIIFVIQVLIFSITLILTNFLFNRQIIHNVYNDLKKIIHTK